MKSEWRRLAPPWIEEMRGGRNAIRFGLLDPVMLDACGDVAGLTVLDSGCGEGRFCRLLVNRGAVNALGIDLCEPMIEAARELASGRDTYETADVENLHFLESETFDLAVSYLNQCDLADYEANTREVFRVLKPGGCFVIANVHPMRSASGQWLKAEDGTKQHVILDSYFDEGKRCWKMMGHEFTNFHRSLQSYVDAYRNAGFTIDRIVEPTVSDRNLEIYPELEDERRVPSFIVFTLMKPPDVEPVR